MRQDRPQTVYDNVMEVLRPIIEADNAIGAGRVVDFIVGNGCTITEYAADLLVQAQHEVLLSTCFWAKSNSLATLHDALIALNNRARAAKRRVAVKILFSSYSFSQKFLSFRGVQKWSPKAWKSLGLSHPSALDSLDMTVVSRFRKPLGIMHAKFLVIDRKTVVIMSSNLSCISFNISL